MSLRVACVGTGFIAQRHLAALAALPDVAVVAVADPASDRARAAADAHGARAYDDGLALLAAEELDAVWLCVPPYAHGPLEAAALDRGLPFFVEKPLAVDAATAEAVAARVAETGLLTAVGYHWRHLSLVEAAAALLRDRPPHLVTGTWLAATPAAPWWSRRAQSGGQVVEQTTHLLDLARVLAGEVTSVQAVESPAADAASGADVPSASTALLTFASGAVGTVSSARSLGWRQQTGLQLLGARQVVDVVERALDDHELRVRDDDGETVTASREDPVLAEDREFLAVLTGDAEAVRVPYAEALRSHRLACAVDRAAREGARVELEPAGAPEPVDVREPLDG